MLSCEDNGRNYKVYLVATEDDDKNWEKNNAKNKVTFQVVDVNNGETVVWGPRAVEDKEWTNWKLRVTRSEGVFMNVPKGGNTYEELDYLKVKCQNPKIEIEKGNAGTEVDVSAEEELVQDERRKMTRLQQLKVEVDTNNCRASKIKGQEECEIKFAHGINLRLGFRYY